MTSENDESIDDLLRAVAAAPELPVPLRAGVQAGRYVVLGSIGAGAMGMVYAARDPQLGRTVALKVLQEERQDVCSEVSRSRLLREAQAIAQLSHPNVITVFDVGEVEGAVFLAMEVVEGGTLTDWMRAPGHSWRDVVGVLCSAGEGLAAVHAAGLVHRDFKPDNVLIGSDSRVRISDFGLARTIGVRPTNSDSERTADAPGGARRDQGGNGGSGAQLTSHVTRFAGTPAYAAPEQWVDGVADARSDLFSFCVTFYEALYGVRPFVGDTLAELSAAMTRGSITPGSPHGRVPEWLRRLIIRGLCPDPTQRPPSLRVLLDDIQRRARRRRARIGWAAVAVTLASVLAALVTFKTIRARERTTVRAQALEAYESGLRRLRDGDRPASAAKDYARALALDATLPQAHLRYALAEFWEYQLDAREHLARAVEGSHSLNESDKLLLAAAQALMQSQPANTAEYARLLDDAIKRYPADMDLVYRAPAAHYNAGDRPGAVALADRVLRSDPGLGGMYYIKSSALDDAGDPIAALATIATCEARARNPIRCLSQENAISASEGDYVRLEQTARKILLKDPTDNFPYMCLAEAAYAGGQPVETVRELLRQHVARSPPPVQARLNLEHLWALDVLAGNFEAALARLRELETAVASESDQTSYAILALRQTSSLLERGQPLEAGRIAQAFLRRKQAWIGDPRRDEGAVSRDPTVRLLLAERRAQLISDDSFQKERRAWVERWTSQLTVDNSAYVWLYGYAAAVETADDARKALSAWPTGRPLRHSPVADGVIGALFLRADRPADALPYLRRAARACSALQYPLEHVRAQFLLGQALAATHQRKEACDAYLAVLTRWAGAKPRSVTAEQARAAAHDLGCPVATISSQSALPGVGVERP
jgi:serine/threonine-protein kinase